MEAIEVFADKSSNAHFCLRLAVEKVTAKLADQGFGVEVIAEMLTRPGHVVDLLNMAEDLHIKAVDAVAAGRVVLQ